MIKMRIGIDLSINSSGLVFIIEKDDKVYKEIFYRIIPEEMLTKGKKNINIVLKTYKKEYDKKNYSSEDISKIKASYRLADKLKEIISENIKKFKPDYIDASMEGSVLSTSFKKQQSRLNDLTMYNTMTKFMLVSLLNGKIIHNIFIVPPTTLKKYAVGKGNAKKELMIEEFIKKKPKFDELGKIDDVIDAYWLAYCKFTEDMGIN